jgi:hypothetical protein
MKKRVTSRLFFRYIRTPNFNYHGSGGSSSGTGLLGSRGGLGFRVGGEGSGAGPGLGGAACKETVVSA